MLAENTIKLRELHHVFVKILFPLRASASLSDVSLDHVPLSRGIAPVPWSRFITATKEIEAATFDPHRQPNGLV
jgi:hypothetical protein